MKKGAKQVSKTLFLQHHFIMDFGTKIVYNEL